MPCMVYPTSAARSVWRLPSLGRASCRLRLRSTYHLDHLVIHLVHLLRLPARSLLPWPCRLGLPGYCLASCGLQGTMDVSDKPQIELLRCLGWEMNDMQKEQIIRMRHAGFEYSRIAPSLGLSENTVKEWSDRSRATSWTDEMREAVRQRVKERSHALWAKQEP